jgi:hypothetical protein
VKPTSLRRATSPRWSRSIDRANSLTKLTSDTNPDATSQRNVEALRRAKVWALAGVTRLAEFLGGLLFLKLIEERPHLILDGHQFRHRGVREEQGHQRPVQCRKLACECRPPQSRHRTKAIGDAASNWRLIRGVGRTRVVLMRSSETAEAEDRMQLNRVRRHSGLAVEVIPEHDSRDDSAAAKPHRASSRRHLPS